MGKYGAINQVLGWLKIATPRFRKAVKRETVKFWQSRPKRMFCNVCKRTRWYGAPHFCDYGGGVPLRCPECHDVYMAWIYSGDPRSVWDEIEKQRALLGENK
jgi:hypothetical protein